MHFRDMGEHSVLLIVRRQDKESTVRKFIAFSFVLDGFDKASTEDAVTVCLELGDDRKHSTFRKGVELNCPGR